jgi:preprotein translocase subunit SecE
VSGGTGVAEERNTDREDGQQPSRPVTAAARRERRAAARPAARRDAVGTEAETTVEPAVKSSPKGKTTGSVTRRRAAKTDSGPPKSPDAKGRPTRARDDRGPRVSLFSKLFRFLREVVAELRKVIWPTRKQMITYTSVVLVFLAVMVALIAGLDVGLARGVLWLFG